MTYAYEYERMWHAKCIGLLTDEEWKKYCERVLWELMTTYADVLERLKVI